MSKSKSPFVTLIAALLLGTFCLGGLAMAQEHKPKPLDEKDKMMMKNMAMKNMDKYMASKQAMMQLPKHVMETQKAAIERGKKLFNDKKALSANGMACASCHPGGGTTGGEVETPMPSEVTGKPYKLPVPSLIGAAATFPKYKVPNDAVIDLADMTNNCVMMFMMAKPLKKDSREMRDLVAYITTLSNDESIEVGKMPAMMKMMSKKK